ncbi:Leucine rich repeat-containing protein [Lachnospiraceae bacterium]|nr:Leucine rich repeat-containing protein [Lachnospiraceae bacterium]
MKIVKKRSWALALALAMIMSLFTGISAKAYGGVPEDTGLVLAWEAGRNEETGDPFKSDDDGWYTNDFGFSIRDEALVYIGYTKDEKLAAADVSKVKIENADTNEDITDKVFFEPYTGWDDEQRQKYTPDEGFFRIKIDQIGDYIISVDNKYAVLRVGLPEIGVYDSDGTFTSETMATDRRIIRHPVDKESVYYFKFMNDDAESCVLDSVKAIVWNEEKHEEEDYNSDKVKLEKVDDSLYKITIAPDCLDYFDVVCEGTITWGENNSNNMGNRFFFDPLKEGLLISDPDWQDDGPHFSDDVGRYDFGFGSSAREGRTIALAVVKDDTITPVSDINALSITDMEGNPIAEDDAMITNQYYDEDNLKTYAPGLFEFKINKCGDYKINYKDGDNNLSVDIFIGLPEVAIYSANTASEAALVCARNEWLKYEPGKKYYIIALDDVKKGDWYTGGSIAFIDELETPDINDWDFSSVEFTVPAAMVDHFWEGIFVRLPQQDGNTNEFRFGLEGENDGLLIADSDWRDAGDDIWRDYAKDPQQEPDAFQKNTGTDIYYNRSVTLGFRNGDGITLLKKDSLGKLSIVDDKGDKVPESIATIEMGGYTTWDDVNKKDIYHEIDDVFYIYINKTGKYRLVYTNGDDKSMISIDAGLPNAAIFGTKMATEKYILAGCDTNYNKDRRTFYIMTMNQDSDDYKRTVTITSKPRGRSSDATVSMDENGVITVNISEEATDDIEVNADFHRMEEWYYQDNNGNWVKSGDSYDDFDISFWFHPGDDVVKYSDDIQADIDKADNVTKLVDELPDANKISVQDEAAVKAAVEAAEALSDEQKKLVDASVFEELEAVKAALDEAIEEAGKNAEEAKKVVDKINALSSSDKIKAADKDAIESVKKAYDALTADQKKYVDDDVVAKLSDALEAVKIAIVKEADEKAKTEAIQAAVKQATDALKKQADADKAKAIEDAKKEAAKAAEDAAKKAEAEKAAAVEAAKQADVPKVGDEILDTTSKAVYKVLTAANGATAGTVQYVGPSKKAAKVKIPESITYKDAKYTVVSIAASAFEGDTKLTTVTIPSTVTAIGSKAFSGCTKLKTINIYGNNLKSINKTAFKNIKKKAKFNIYVSDKKKFNSIKKWIQKSKPKKAKYIKKNAK